jgi:hypothetical protein
MAGAGDERHDPDLRLAAHLRRYVPDYSRICVRIGQCVTCALEQSSLYMLHG